MTTDAWMQLYIAANIAMGVVGLALSWTTVRWRRKAFAWLTLKAWLVVFASGYVQGAYRLSLDWAWTTPLTALMLFSIAQAPAGVTRRQVALSLVGCGLMVGAGALATDRALDATWVWFALSCLGMLAVTGGLVRAMRPGVPTLYAPLLGLTVVTWSLFPLVWLLDAARLDRFLILNLFAKLSLFTLVLILTWREVVSDWRMKS